MSSVGGPREDRLTGTGRWLTAHPMLSFCLLAFAISWGVMIAYAASQASLIPVRLPYEFAWLGQFGPSIAAFMLVAWHTGTEGVWRLMKRGVYWRVGIGWYTFVLLFAPTIWLMVLSVHRLLGYTVPAPDITSWYTGFANLLRDEPSAGIFSALSAFAQLGPLHALVLVIVFSIVSGGISEEFGWRGYLLPRLQNRRAALTASLIVGLLWTVWHVPPANWDLLLTSGAGPFLQAMPGILLPGLYMVPLAVLFTWVYNGTEGSVLLAILFHAVGNMSFMSFSLLWEPLTATATPMYLVGVWLVTILVIVLTGPRHLSRSGERVMEAVPEGSLQPAGGGLEV